MAFASGIFVTCAAPGCDSPSLTTVRESFDEIDRIFVGEQVCNTCGARMLFSRRANTPEEISMAKRKPGRARASTMDRKLTRPDTNRPKATARRKSWSAHRVNTHKGNGSLSESQEVAPGENEQIPVGEAMRRAVEALGSVAVDPGLAPAQMLELGECYESVARMQAAFDTRSEAAKTAKKSLESAQALLLEKVRSFTHPKPLPLFDAPQAEQDRQDMLAGGGDATA